MVFGLAHFVTRAPQELEFGGVEIAELYIKTPFFGNQGKRGVPDRMEQRQGC